MSILFDHKKVKLLVLIIIVLYLFSVPSTIDFFNLFVLFRFNYLISISQKGRKVLKKNLYVYNLNEIFTEIINSEF